MPVSHFINSLFLTDLGKSLIFCYFPNVFSQSYIVRFFRFTIVLINILLVEIDFRVKVEILNLAVLSCLLVTLFQQPKNLDAQISRRRDCLDYVYRQVIQPWQQKSYFDIFYPFLKSNLHQIFVRYLISILKYAQKWTV